MSSTPTVNATPITKATGEIHHSTSVSGHAAVLPHTHETIVRPAIVEETTRVDHIKEVTPVIHREVDQTIIHHTQQHIYEKAPSQAGTILNAPVIDETIKTHEIDDVQPIIHREKSVVEKEQVQEHRTIHVQAPTQHTTEVVVDTVVHPSSAVPVTNTTRAVPTDAQHDALAAAAAAAGKAHTTNPAALRAADASAAPHGVGSVPVVPTTAEVAGEAIRDAGNKAAAVAGDVANSASDIAHAAAPAVRDAAVTAGNAAVNAGNKAAAVAGDVANTATDIAHAAAPVVRDAAVTAGNAAVNAGTKAAAVAGDVANTANDMAHAAVPVVRELASDAAEASKGLLASALNAAAAVGNAAYNAAASAGNAALNVAKSATAPTPAETAYAASAGHPIADVKDHQALAHEAAAAGYTHVTNPAAIRAADAAAAPDLTGVPVHPVPHSLGSAPHAAGSVTEEHTMKPSQLKKL